VKITGAGIVHFSIRVICAHCYHHLLTPGFFLLSDDLVDVSWLNAAKNRAGSSMRRQSVAKAILRATLYLGAGLLGCWLAVTAIQTGYMPGDRHRDEDIVLANHPVWFWLYEISFCCLAGTCLYVFYRHVRWLLSRGEPASRQNLDDLDLLEIDRAWAYPDFRPLPFVRTGAVGSYVAGNPWQNGHQDRFTVEVYQRAVPIPAHDNRPANQSPSAPNPLRPNDSLAIRFDRAGRSHRLPDSLASLWRSGQVSTEALPQLLHELLPQLRRSDYKPMLEVWGYEWTGIFVALLCLGSAALCLIVVPPDADGTGSLGVRPVGATAFFLMGLGFLLGLDGYTRRLRQRRRQQARWIMAAIEGNSATPHVPDTGTT
jgi:hypothetical protein